ncbi:protein ALP1-like [Trichonephila clavipes]|nr:protein ALP1-like [Trichonephila clavipes]
MASDDQVILALGFAAICDIEMWKAKKRKIWQRKWLQRRIQLGCYIYENLMKELALEDSESYRRFLRMDVSTFKELVALVSPSIERKNTSMRKAIPAAAESYQSRIAQNTISGIIPAVCAAIYHHLGSEIQVPESENEWKDGHRRILGKVGFSIVPWCNGQKTHANKPPSHSGATYRNYKGFFNIALLALVDANLKILYVDVGTNGRVSEGGVWGKSKLMQAITNGDMNIPEAATLPGSTSKLPFVIVADDAFPLMPNIMKPYPGSNLSKECLVFNYRLSRARRVSENAFGILAARFRVFGITILTSVRNTKLIVLAACSLHNFLTNSLSAEIVEVEIEVVSPSIVPSGNFAELNRTVTCMVLKANDRRTSCPCHDEFRGPRSDYVRQVALENNNNNKAVNLYY